MQDMFLNGKNYAEKYLYRYLTQSDITAYGYSQQLLNAPEWFMEMSAPGDPLMSISYRFCCSANGLQAQALALRIMGLQGLAGNPAMFDYLNRYVTQIVPNYNWTQFYSPFPKEMHSAYSAAF